MFKKFFHGLARAFTIPAKERAIIDNSAIGVFGKNLLRTQLNSAINTIIDAKITDTTENAAFKSAIDKALTAVGL